ncbi:2-dehydro-3-deoxy-6-phosphogalactonate aldolase [Paraburkholderia acidisoli]|uniref:2-dehydro-3-deoxy-6-phosphogalactonate aldolase n=1 Tax=Paraburkholderia acidisoli TaxID=2571748 RepID=A0A7Z2JHV4_9BURK|nr:2-dehydro-3-deoxy-6-phosphogalactonate aldolase [Paraburkholderia acidisoli]QGZ66202.1 2-dehydro-3-deoxy-6-phosphogalactonate aldolase [Paraburkholderia acidisoli]
MTTHSLSNDPRQAGTRARFDTALSACPLIAILRGIECGEAAAHASALYEAGFRVIEVPLNSPSPLDSIEAIRKTLPPDAIVGAGTVLTRAEVLGVSDAGGELIVMPHSDPEVLAAAVECGLVTAPGVATPTEAFAALKSGADALKLFPFEQLGHRVLKAWRSVMNPGIALIPVGGVRPEDVGALLKAGARGLGLGSGLYRSGQTVDATRATAQAYVAACEGARFTA